MRKIPWEEICNKYIYGIEKDGKIEFPTVKDLAEEYDIAVTTIGEHSSKEGWVKLRENYLNERRIKGEQKVGQKFNRNSTEIQQVCFYNKVRELSGNCQSISTKEEQKKNRKQDIKVN